MGAPNPTALDVLSELWTPTARAQVLSSALLALALYAWLSRPRVIGRPKPMESDPEALSEDEVCGPPPPFRPCTSRLHDPGFRAQAMQQAALAGLAPGR